MHRTEGDSYGTALSAKGQTVHVYRDAVLGDHESTQLKHEEMNAVQEEIANVIEAENIALHDGTETVATMNQLNTAIENKLKATRIENDSMASGDFVDEALTIHQASISLIDQDVTALETAFTAHRHGAGGIPKVNISTDTDDTLPFNRVAAHVHSIAQAGLINIVDHSSGILPIQRQWTDKALVSLAFTGFSAGNTCSLICLKSNVDTESLGVQYEVKKYMFYGMMGTSNGTAFSTNAGAIPADYCPDPFDTSHNILVYDNGAYYPGIIIIKTNGQVLIRKCPSYGNNIDHAEALFTATGTKGFLMCAWETFEPY